MRKSLSLVALLAVTAAADARDIREWVGGPGNYGSSSNWIPPVTPGPGDIAYVTAAGSHPTANGNYTVQNLLLQSGTSFSIASGFTFTTETICVLLDTTFDIEPGATYDGAFDVANPAALVQIDGTWLVPDAPITHLDGGTLQGFGAVDARNGWIDIEFGAEVDVVMPFSPFMLGRTRLMEDSIFTIDASKVVAGDPAVDAVLGPLVFSGGILDVQTPAAWRLGGALDALENASHIRGAPVVFAGADIQLTDSYLGIDTVCTVEPGTTAEIGLDSTLDFDEVTFSGGTFTGLGTVDLDESTVVDGVVNIDVLTWDDPFVGPPFPVLVTPSGALHINEWVNERDGALTVQGLLATESTILAVDGITLDAPGRVEGSGSLALWNASDMIVRPFSTGAASVANLFRIEGGAVVNQGAELRLEGETWFRLLPGAMTGTGTIRQVGDLTVEQSATITLNGRYDWDGDEENPSSTEIYGNQTLHISVDSIEDPGLFEGYDGVVVMYAGSTLHVDTPASSWLHQGAIFAIEGGTIAGDDIFSGGEFIGEFTAQGLDIISDGVLRAYGPMSITLGGFTLGGNNLLDIVIDSSTEYGFIAAVTPFVNNGVVVLGGRLEICLGLYVPQIGESFDVVVANTIESGFHEIYAPGFELSYHYGNPPLSNGYVRATYVGIAEDLDGDGHVRAGDLLFLLGEWGACDGDCPADLDGSGTVDVLDLLIVIGAWTDC